MTSGIRHLVLDALRLTCDVRHLTVGIWYLTLAIWHLPVDLTFDMLDLAFCIWHLTFDYLQLTFRIWHNKQRQNSLCVLIFVFGGGSVPPCTKICTLEGPGPTGLGPMGLGPTGLGPMGLGSTGLGPTRAQVCVPMAWIWQNFAYVQSVPYITELPVCQARISLISSLSGLI